MFRIVRTSILVLLVAALLPTSTSASTGPGVGSVPQGTQTDAAYARSFASNNVVNRTVRISRDPRGGLGR